METRESIVVAPSLSYILEESEQEDQPSRRFALIISGLEEEVEEEESGIFFTFRNSTSFTSSYVGWLDFFSALALLLLAMALMGLFWQLIAMGNREAAAAAGRWDETEADWERKLKFVTM